MSKSASINYPCFSSDVLHPGGMLLHISTACTMQCRYCFAVRESGLGRSLERTGTFILTEEAAVGMVDRRIETGVPPSIIEIGGPGEPLLLADTYAILRQLHASYPDLSLSVWTNGVLVPDRIGDLVHAGVSRMTLSLSAATPEATEGIYDWVIYRGRKYIAREAAELVLQQQWNGLVNAIEAGMIVTVYIAGIRGVNDHEVPMVRLRAEEIGADRVVVVPLGE
jgi:nitrogen fixation protein NifB